MQLRRGFKPVQFLEVIGMGDTYRIDECRKKTDLRPFVSDDGIIPQEFRDKILNADLGQGVH